MMIYAGGAGSDQRYRREKMKQIRLLWMIIKRCNADKVLYAFVISFFASAFVVMLAEPGISSYGEGLWYCFVACTTIGFGDFAAVTLIGRIATVYIALCQIMLVAILPGIIVTYYMEVIHRREQESLTMFMDKLERLPELSREELEQIAEKVRKIR